MIELYQNLLTSEEKEFLKNKCDNFIETHSPFVDGDTNRSYHKYKLDETSELLDLQSRFLSFVRKQCGPEIEFVSFVINRADVNTNKNDTYHTHKNTAFALITYLNEDFTGGDFVYFLDNKHTHIPINEGLSILMNNEIPHKITHVTSGVRFSFACFFNYIPKTKKSLI